MERSFESFLFYSNKYGTFRELYLAHAVLNLLNKIGKGAGKGENAWWMNFLKNGVKERDNLKREKSN